jgi:hypothetical protein
VEVHSWHGSTASPTITNVASAEMRHKLADNDTADLNAPVPVPAAGTKYGWRKYTKLYVASGLGSQIGNIRFFAAAKPSDWVNSCDLFAGTTPSYAAGTAADEAGQLGGTANVNSYDSTSPLTVNSSAGAITASASYGSQDYVLQQIGVLSTATNGVKTARTLTYRYDEI